MAVIWGKYLQDSTFLGGSPSAISLERRGRDNRLSKPKGDGMGDEGSHNIQMWKPKPKQQTSQVGRP